MRFVGCGTRVDGALFGESSRRRYGICVEFITLFFLSAGTLAETRVVYEALHYDGHWQKW
jgi:hypothetical protein